MPLAVPAHAQTDLLDTTMTVGSWGSNLGFNSVNGTGSLADTTFDHDGTTYTISYLFTSGNNLSIITTSAFPLAAFNSFTVTVDTTSYTGGWSASGNTLSVPKGTLNWSDGDSGVTVKITAPSPPGQPEPPVLTQGNKKLDVSWSAPSDTGSSAITDYDVQYRTSADHPNNGDPAGNWMDVTHTGTATTARITGLTNDTPYDVQVRAESAAGEGEWSNHAMATPKPEAPAQVTGLTLTAGDQQIEATWTAPDDGGDAIQGYHVQYRESPSGSWTAASPTHTGTGTSHTITGLTNGTAYGVQVRARNRGGTDGNGPWSAEVTVTLPEPPGQPEPPTLTPGNKKLDVSWSAPSNTGSSAITDYDLRYRTSADHPNNGDPAGAWMDVTHTGTATTARITGLTNDTPYDVAVLARSAAGEGEWSNHANATPKTEAPAQVTGLTLTAGSGQIAASWTAPDDGGDPIRGYDVEYTEEGTTNWQAASPTHTGTGTSHTITGLADGAAYDVRVRAKNFSGATGDGPWSAAMTATTAPGQVTGLALTPGDGQIGVLWTAPAAGTFTGYEVQYTDKGFDIWKDAGHSGTGVEHVITGLPLDYEFSVRVRAKREDSAGSVTGDWSAVKHARTLAPPGQVTGLTLTAGNGEITAAWNAPTGTVTGYDVEYSEQGANSWQTASHSGTGTENTIGGLTNGTAYSVRVRAKNGGVTNTWSLLEHATPLAPPGQVTGLTLTAGNGQIGASWTAPTGTVTGYDVQYTVKDAANWQAVSHSGTDTQTGFDGLANGTEYSVRVRAANGGVPGAWSALAHVTLAALPPGQVTGLALTAGDQRIEALWAAPDGTITGYKVEYTEKDTTNWQAASPAHTGTDTEHTITGLTNGTEYSVRVRATNSESEGEWSALEHATANPPPPGDVVVTGGNAVVNVTWSAAPGYTGSYDVWLRQKNVGSYALRIRTQARAVGLSEDIANGTTYQVRVCAGPHGPDGPHCSAVQEATPTPPSATPAPSSVVVVAFVTRPDLYVSWDTKEKKAPSSYVRWQVKDANPENWQESSAIPNNENEEDYTITGLTDGTTYEVQVGFVYSGSTTKHWSSSRIAVSGGGKAEITELAVTADRIAVTWTDAPGAWAHRVVWKEAGESWPPEKELLRQNPDYQTSPWTTPSLATGRAYDVAVYARYGGGWAAGDSMQVAVPGVPSAVAAEPGASLVRVLWSDAGSADSHSVRHRADGDTNWTETTATTSPHDITSLTDGTKYEVQAGAVYGGDTHWSSTVTATPAAGLPPAPNNLTVNTVTDTSINLTWTTTASGGTIRENRAEYKLASSSVWTHSHDTTESGSNHNSTVTGLTKGVDYDFRVRERSDTGWGPVSAVLRANTALFPQNVSPQPGQGQFTISWEGSGDSFKLQYRAGQDVLDDDNQAGATTVENVTSPHTVTAPPQEYQIRVGLVSGNRTYWSRNQFVKSTTRPVAVSDLVVTPGDGALTAAWTRTATPRGPDNTGETEYVQVRAVGDSDWVSTHWSDTTSPHTFTKKGFSSSNPALVNGTTYEVRIQSRYSLLNPTVIKFSDIVTATPGGPSGVTVAPGDAKLTVSWTDVSGADSHSVQYRTSGANTWTAASGTANPREITGLTNNTKYEVQVGAVVGADTRWSPTVTGTPRNTAGDVALTTGDGSLSVSWTDWPGAASHSVRHRESGAANWTTATSATSPYAISSLTNGTTYEVQVAAVVGADTRWSPSVTATLPVAGDIEVAPGNEKLSVSWTAAPGASSHTLRWREGATGAWAVRENASSGHTIAGLANGTSYEVQVGAVVDDVTRWSGTVTAKPTDGPTGVTAMPGNRALTVSWTDGPTANAHSVRYRINGSNNWSSRIKVASPYKIANLTNNTEYEVQVGAEISLSGTRWSDSVLATPGAPVEVDVLPGAAQVQVLWSAADGAASHTVRHRESGTTSWTATTSATSPHDITGLTDGTTYEVQVGAVYGADTLWSSTLTATPAGGLPAAPTDLGIGTVTDTSLQFSWTSGGGETRHRIEYKLASSSVWSRSQEEEYTGSSAMTVTGLTTGVDYDFRVRYRNTVGWSPASAVLRSNTAVVPRNVDRTDGEGQFTVTWESPYATQFKLQYRAGSDVLNDANTEGAIMAENVFGSPHTVIVVGGQYRYRVGAVYDGRTYWSSDQSAFPTAKPVSVTDLVVTPGDGELTATWTRAPGADFEQVRFREVGTTEWKETKFGNTTSSETFTKGWRSTDPSLVNGTAYEVRIMSRFSSVNPTVDKFSDTITATPGGVAGVTVAPGDTKLTVSWTGGSHADSYVVRHRTSGGSWPTTPAAATSPYEITSLTNGTAYDVQVGAVVSGDTRWSPTVAGTPAAGAGGMGAPMGFSARSGDRAVSLSWQMPAEPEDEQPSANTVKGFSNPVRINSDAPPAPETPTSYEVGYTVEGSEWSEGGSQTVSDMAASISGLENGTAYAFRVRAKAGEETSAWSKTVVATPEDTNRPTGLANATTSATAWKTMDLSFNAPAEGTDWVAANSQYRLRSMKEGANRTPWRPLQNLSVADGRVTASTGSYLAVGRIFEVEVRWCKETVSDATCSAASDMVHGASPASAPENGQASATDPASQTALALAWSIANTGGKKNMHAAYEIGWSADTAATAPATLLDTVPAFGETAAEVSGLTAGTEYRLFVRSVIDHEGDRLFASAWASATATTEGAPALTLGAGPADPAWVAGTAIAALVLPEATGGTGAVTYALAPASWNGITVDTATRTLSGTPAAAGSQAFTWTATDAAGASDSLTFTATVTASDTVAPTAALALADGVETPAVAPFSITVTFSETVTGFALDDLTVAHGAASAFSGSGASYSATITPEEGYAGNLTVDVAAGAAQDAAGNASMAAETLTVAVAPPVTKPTGVATNTTAATSWKTLDLSFDAPPAYTGWTAAQSQYRVRSVKEGANRTPWRALQNVSVADGTASASTGSYLAIGRVFEVELRYCGETISDAACSGASDMVYGASPASAPENAQASATEPASQTALTLSWSIANIGGKKNMHAAYEIGWSADTGATAPETLLTTVPDFGETEAEVGGLEAGGGYRLFVRSVIDWQGARLFASNWASAVGTTAASANGLANRMLKQVLVVKARRLLEDASDVIGRRMADGGPGNDAFSAFAGLFGGQGPGGCTLAESIEDCVTRGSSGGGGLGFGSNGFGPGERFGSGSHAGFGGSGADGGAETRSFSLSDLRGLLKSRGFAVSLNRPLPRAGAQFSQDPSVPDEGMQLTLWGQGAAGGADSAMFWGMDASGAGWMTGVAFAESGHSASSALSAGGGRMSGFAESAVTAVYPYAKGRFASGLELWSLAGWGTGRVDSTWTGFASASGPEERIDLDGGLGFSLGMMGAEQVLYEAGGLSLSAVGDAGWSRLAASGGTADGVSAAVHRTRFAVSGRYEAGGLTSSLRLGGRMDGGDGETASGAEVSGDMRHAWGRWEAGAQGRWYTAETTGAGFGEQGVRAALGLRAREDGTGLAFALSPGWGTEAGALHGGGLLGVLDGDAGAAARSPAAHLDGRLSWGARIPGLVAGPELLRPWAAFSLSGGASRHFRTGLALEGPIRMNLALERRESAAGPAEHGIMLRIDTRF